ncbi:serine/threonine protein kinase [Streptomyces sp. NRRL F-4489]|uniref:serine/threonine-protein kinase n=1 Tax=Streptomyces sp. NRRL F-4489 TaxID=1609095 RepID=UPI000747C9B8|nr:serine/threonine-protein kinase [Streptomyces sp. NRRL F-4489]KUL37535.1 serine/threonine protein kinase [Streptomyces sp. NRRL F-4489]
MAQPGRTGRQGRVGRSGALTPLGPQDPRRIGEYRLLGRLGEGGMGRVFLARSDRGRTVAVKLVREELAHQEEFRARFRREVRAARTVGGEWTAPVLDADTEAATPWLATGYIAGPSLQQVVGGGAPLPERTVRILAAGLARALGCVHAAGLVHRDLKPSNVLLTLDGPRVIDFGIARALEGMAGGVTHTGAAVGSPGFMAPEQVRGEPLTPACDVFCLGSVLVYAATGRQPFGSATTLPHAMMYRIAEEEPDLTGLPEGLTGLVTACLAKDPARRPTPEQLVALAERGLPAGGAAEDEPWLPGPLVARLGRHAVELLEAEDPGDGGPATAPGGVGSARVPEYGAAAPTPEYGAPPTPEYGAAAPAPGGSGPAPVPYTAVPQPGTPATPAPAPTPPPAPARRRRAGRRKAGRTLLAGAALALAGAGAATAYVLLGGAPGDASATERATAPARPAGGIPDAYLGVWSTTVGDSALDVRRFTLVQGKPGQTVLRMQATGPTYDCRFTATLESAGPPVRLGPSTVVSGPPDTCRPGSPSTLELMAGKLRRTFDDAGGKAPLLYTRAK